MTNRYWFKPKTYGYGATPTTWEGWVLVAAGIAVIALSSFVLLGLKPHTAGILLWGAVVLATVFVLVVVSHRKTDGQWHWRWGSRADAG
ncbi:MAG: hypothetical protein AB1490_26950 [Pseudomonadota bacterium]